MKVILTLKIWLAKCLAAVTGDKRARPGCQTAKRPTANLRNLPAPYLRSATEARYEPALRQGKLF